MDKTIIFDNKFGERVVKNESELDEQERVQLWGEFIKIYYAAPTFVQEKFINELLKELNQQEVNEEPAPKKKERPQYKRKIQPEPGKKEKAKETKD